MYNQDYLCHYGVPGMRLGRRQNRRQQINSNAREYRLGVNREKMKFIDRNQAQIDKNIDSHKNFSDKRKAKLHANNKSVSDIAKVRLDYKNANLKAKQDRKFLESDEYFNSVSSYGKQRVGELVLGAKGYKKMQTYKNLGDSSKKAAGKVLVTQLITGAAASVAVGALTYQIAKSDAFQYAKKIVGG